MSWNRQESVRSKDYNFAGFGGMRLEILHFKSSAAEPSAEPNANRVDICQEMFEIPERLGPRQKNYGITGDDDRFTVIIITGDNG
jgi:hypothetical protein